MEINDELIKFIKSCKRESNNNKISLYFSDHDHKLKFMYPFSYDKWDDGVYVTKSLFRDPSMDIPEFRSSKFYLFVFYKYSVDGVTTYFIDLDGFKNNKWYTTGSTEDEMNKLMRRYPGISPNEETSYESYDRVSEMTNFIKDNENKFIKLDELTNDEIKSILVKQGVLNEKES